MSKRPSFGSHFEKLKSLGVEKSLDAQKLPVLPRSPVVAPEGLSPSSSSILEESLSPVDTVRDKQGSERTESNLDSVVAEPCEKRRVSATDTVQEGFTRVPHSLLRGEAKFDEPLDFMVYLHLFTYSYGFGRREAHMSQAQLERFTGAAKNTIKRSLERLAKQGWIKCIEEYECARMSRKWRVMSPEDRSGRGGLGGKRALASSDSVRDEPSPAQTGSLSSADPLTVSKLAPYKERDPKEKTKNSLSVDAPALRDYFAIVKPIGKRESEWKAFQGLRQDFSGEQVAACLEYLQEKGIPGSGAPCHSPMGFLSKAMGQVWGEVQSDRERRAKSEARAKAEANAVAARLADEAEAEREIQEREEAFVRAYPREEEQSEVVARYGAQLPMLARGGQVLRGLAINAWWVEQIPHHHAKPNEEYPERID